MSRRTSLTAACLALLLPTAAAAQVAVFGSTVRERAASPGEEYTGVIRIGNIGDQPREVRVYQKDYRFDADGRNWYPDPGSHRRSNAPWTSLIPRRLHLPPGETGRISFTVQVPDSLAEQGTFWSLVMIEPLSSRPGVGGEAPEEAGDMGVQTRVRYGVQIATHVPGAGGPEVEFRGLRLSEEPETGPVLVLDLHNRSATAIRPRLSFELYDGEGRRAASGEEQRGLLYPGTSLRQRFELGELDSGVYQAVILADPGEGDLFGAQYEVRIAPRDGTGDAAGGR